MSNVKSSTPKKKQKKFPYSVRKDKRARWVRIAVYCDERVVVTSPYGVRQSSLDRFVAERSDWVSEQIADFRRLKRSYGVPVRKFGQKDYLENRDRALALAERRLAFYNVGYYGFSYNKVSVRNQKTCWGSCSNTGNISLNYKILYLPRRLRDYVVVHELCHLEEFNHSEQFWALVARVFPDYVRLRKNLQQYDLLFS